MEKLFPLRIKGFQNQVVQSNGVEKMFPFHHSGLTLVDSRLLELELKDYSVHLSESHLCDRGQLTEKLHPQ